MNGTSLFPCSKYQFKYKPLLLPSSATSCGLQQEMCKKSHELILQKRIIFLKLEHKHYWTRDLSDLVLCM